MKIFLILSLLTVSNLAHAASPFRPLLVAKASASFSGGCSIDADCPGVDSFCSGATQDYPGICECSPYGVQPINVECGPGYVAPVVPSKPANSEPSNRSCVYDTDCPASEFCSGVSQDYPGICR